MDKHALYGYGLIFFTGVFGKLCWVSYKHSSYFENRMEQMFHPGYIWGEKRKRKQSVFRSNMVKFVHGAVLVEVKASYMERNLGEL